MLCGGVLQTKESSWNDRLRFTFSIMFFSHKENTKSSLGRALLLIWLFVVLIINSSYTASLTSILSPHSAEAFTNNSRNLELGIKQFTNRHLISAYVQRPGMRIEEGNRSLSNCILKEKTNSSHKNTSAVFRGFQSTEQLTLPKTILKSSLVLKKNTSFLKCRCVARNGSLQSTRGVDEAQIQMGNLVTPSGVSMIGLGKGLVTSTKLDTDTIAFDTMDAEITHETNQFFVSEDDDDLDSPSKGFCSIPEAIQAIRQGKLVIAVDDEDRENEGDLIMAASLVTPEALAFIVKHGTGIVCVAMKEEDLDRLGLPLMVPDKENEEKLLTAFTLTVDAKVGTSTGVSAADRANTILALASPDSKPGDFRRPGHIFPLKYREGGVLKRAGHTEASVDLAILAGLRPAAVLCEIVDDDGSMARLPRLREFAKEHNLLLISIADLVRYKRKREKLVERSAIARLPTMWGPFQVYCYRSKLDGIEHVAMVKGNIGDGLDVLVRVHSECLTGDIFGSARCDCGNQLAQAMQQIEQAGRGVLVYLRGHEGRGIGLGHKLRAYNLQDEGRDTVEANVELGLPVDSREYGIGAQILRDIGVRTIRLMTNNPTKYVGLRGYGLKVAGRVAINPKITDENKRYLETKRSKMGHIYGTDTSVPFSSVLQSNAIDKAASKLS